MRNCLSYTALFCSLLTSLLSVSCSSEPLSESANTKVKVGLFVGGDNRNPVVTRSVSGADGLSSIWEESDVLGVWATDSRGVSVLDNERFTMYGLNSSSAFFTAELDSEMPDGSYTYFASSPQPLSVSGNVAYFVIPSSQNGRSGNGEDIMFSDKVLHGPLKSIDWKSSDGGEFHLPMHHLLHRMRFYVDSKYTGGESIERVIAEYPKPVVGKIGVSLDKPVASGIISDGSQVVDIDLKDPVRPSTASERHYVTSSIVPVSFESGDVLKLTLYTRSKVLTAELPLGARTFAAGHSTPVAVVPESVTTNCLIEFKLTANNLGEDISTVTVSAPDGCYLTDDGRKSLTLNYGQDIAIGKTYSIRYEDMTVFNALNGKELTVTYESEHVVISQTVQTGDLVSNPATTLEIAVPYLLYEDFSNVRTFSSHDAYAVSSAGSKDAYSFLDGWTGGRIGAEAGLSIRLACRRETSVDYDARVESAPLNVRFKSPVRLKVEFDYGADEDHGGILPSAVGQNCYIGYVTSKNGYKSGSTEGTYDRTNNTFYVKESTGSYSNTPNHAEYILDVTEVPDLLRISWRTEVEHMAGANNNTVWLYIDNVKVSIADK